MFSILSFAQKEEGKGLFLEFPVEFPHENQTVEHTGSRTHQPRHVKAFALPCGQGGRLAKELLMQLGNLRAVFANLFQQLEINNL